jgi:hypothetical protein
LTKRSSYPQLHSQIRFPVQQVVQDQNEVLVKANRLFPIIEALNTAVFLNQSFFDFKE